MVTTKGVIMAITEAKQSGNNVYIKRGSNSTSFSGTLIGFTPKAVYYTSGKNLHIFKSDGRHVGKHISLLNGDEPIMYGQYVGIKRNGRIYLYDKNGKNCGTKNA